MFAIKKIVLGVAAAAALSACSMAPKYAQPQVETGPFPVVSGSLNPSGQVAATRLGWQDYFADARLQALMALALENNRDLRVAALNVEAVRAQYAIARADRLPALGATGTGNKGRVAQDLSATGQSYITESYTAGLGIAAFELDLFGRVKSLSDNALNQYFAQTQNRDAAQISLIATVAKAYFAERSAQERMDLAARVLKSREESKKLTDLKFKSGVISAIDVRVAETQIETARADYAVAEQARTQARTALALLIGQPLPDTLPAGASLDAQFVNAELPVVLPQPEWPSRQAISPCCKVKLSCCKMVLLPKLSWTC